jgi:hypothetical protein
MSTNLTKHYATTMFTNRRDLGDDYATMGRLISQVLTAAPS